MLTLGRKVGERIVISDNIVIEVVRIDRGRVTLGIQAPDEVPVNREELLSCQRCGLPRPRPTVRPARGGPAFPGCPRCSPPRPSPNNAGAAA